MGEAAEDKYPVDPRVQWCMDIMDQEGHNFEAELDRMMAPFFLAGLPFSTTSLYNVSRRIPIKTNLLYCVAAAPFGYFLGTKFRDWRYAINKENMAIYKHYILTHPERFIEPKRVKYIDLIEPFQPKRG